MFCLQLTTNSFHHRPLSISCRHHPWLLASPTNTTTTLFLWILATTTFTNLLPPYQHHRAPLFIHLQFTNSIINLIMSFLVFFCRFESFLPCSIPFCRKPKPAPFGCCSKPPCIPNATAQKFKPSSATPLLLRKEIPNQATPPQHRRRFRMQLLITEPRFPPPPSAILLLSPLRPLLPWSTTSPRSPIDLLASAPMPLNQEPVPSKPPLLRRSPSQLP